ncbi:MAG TPA: nitrogenase molybdenum-iron protein subunit beta, partial [Firmicutes bacterium]|nr:nitrogenase molybdenum-iron protein subunit beta [Bacillota bacterium]
YVIHTNTPSYIGSHVTGFANMTRSMVDYFSEKTGTPKNQINVIPGWVEPSDMREIKRLAKEMGIKIVLFPDTSDVLDTPQTGKYRMFPKGGVTIPELKSTGDSKATVALGSWTSGPAAEALDAKCKVKCHILDLPIGLQGTDNFINTLRIAAGVNVPDSITEERGRMVDIITDMHQYFYHKKVALVGDPDQLISLTQFLVDLDMLPVHIVTGTSGKAFEERIRGILKNVVPGANVRAGGDMFLLHQWIKNEPVDLIIGNTYCKYIAKDEDIPFVRFGFPIEDRIGHAIFPNVGYQGGMRLLEKILNAFMERQDRDATDTTMELQM